MAGGRGARAIALAAWLLVSGAAAPPGSGAGRDGGDRMPDGNARRAGAEASRPRGAGALRFAELPWPVPDPVEAVAIDPRVPSRWWVATADEVLVTVEAGCNWRSVQRWPGGRAEGDDALAWETPAAPGGTGALLEDEVDVPLPDVTEAEAGAPSTASEPAVAHRPVARSPAGVSAVPGRAVALAAAEGAALVAAPPGVVEVGMDGRPFRTVALAGGAADVRAIATGSGDAAWLATAAGLRRIDGALVETARGAAGSRPAWAVAARADGGAVAAGGEAGLFVSGDGGRSFAGPFPVGGIGEPVRAVAWGPGGTGVAATEGGALVRFDRAGAIVPLAAEGIGAPLRALAIAGEAVFAATARGLFASDDSGGSFEPVAGGIPTLDVRAVAVTGAGVVVVGTDRGPFAASRAGALPRCAAGIVGAPPGARPTVADLLRVAGRNQGIAGRIDRGRIRLAGFAPGLVATVGNDDELDLVRRVAAPSRQLAWGIEARWDLARTVFGPAELAASAIERRRVEARRRLARRIERLVALRQRRLAALAREEPDDPLRRAALRLEIEEAEAGLAGIVGGAAASPARGIGGAP